MKIGIVGCSGRMGRMLVLKVLETPAAVLAGGTERSGSDFVGTDIGTLVGKPPLGLTISDDPTELFARSDVVIDFTSPRAVAFHAELAIQHKTNLVVGTTGLGAEEEAALHAASQSVSVVYAANFSVGVTLLSRLVEKAASALGEDYDIEIVEMHHRHKVDAPSGTALSLGRAAAKGRDRVLEDVWCKSRDGHTGARPTGEIGFATLRGGDVVGDHTVVFAADGERVELTHKASNRSIFAAGAVRAALWTGSRKTGLYSMVDVLGV